MRIKRLKGDFENKHRTFQGHVPPFVCLSVHVCMRVHVCVHIFVCVICVCMLIVKKVNIENDLWMRLHDVLLSREHKFLKNSVILPTSWKTSSWRRSREMQRRPTFSSERWIFWTNPLLHSSVWLKPLHSEVSLKSPYQPGEDPAPHKLSFVNPVKKWVN